MLAELFTCNPLSRSDVPDNVRHHSRPVPFPCLFPHRQAQADQPVEAELSRRAVPEPGHQGAVEDSFQGEGGHRVVGGARRALQRRLQRGHEALSGRGGPRLGVQRPQ